MEIIPSASDWIFASTVLTYEFNSEKEDYNDFYIFEIDKQQCCIHLEPNQNGNGCFTKNDNPVDKFHINSEVSLNPMILDSGIKLSTEIILEAEKIVCPSKYAKPHTFPNGELQLGVTLSSNMIVETFSSDLTCEATAADKDTKLKFWHDHFAYEEFLETGKNERHSSVNSFCGDLLNFLDKNT
jgi:hypothetical protein